MRDHYGVTGENGNPRRWGEIKLVPSLFRTVAFSSDKTQFGWRGAAFLVLLGQLFSFLSVYDQKSEESFGFSGVCTKCSGTTKSLEVHQCETTHILTSTCIYIHIYFFEFKNRFTFDVVIKTPKTMVFVIEKRHDTISDDATIRSEKGNGSLQ